MLKTQAYAFELRLHGSYAVLAAEGELDIACVEQLRAGVHDAARRAGRVVVDLRAVSFLDTFALRALVALQHEIGARPPSTFHVVPGTSIQRVLDVTRMRDSLRWISAEQLAH